jgi:hypothetical protein
MTEVYDNLVVYPESSLYTPVKKTQRPPRQYRKKCSQCKPLVIARPPGSDFSSPDRNTMLLWREQQFHKDSEFIFTFLKESYYNATEEDRELFMDGSSVRDITDTVNLTVDSRLERMVCPIVMAILHKLKRVNHTGKLVSRKAGNKMRWCWRPCQSSTSGSTNNVKRILRF